MVTPPIFTTADFDHAWANAPVLVNKDPSIYRLCYICQFHLEKKQAAHLNEDQTCGFDWTLDLINAKKPELIPKNYIAVHQNCVANRRSLDSRKQLKRILKTPWQFDDEFWTLPPEENANLD